MAEFNQLVQLVTIAESGTISKAAEIIHISQPALTRSMQKLEAEWNVTLFDRQKNKVAFNSTGELAVSYAKRIVSDMEGMTKAVKSYAQSLRTIAIGSSAPAPVLELLSYLTESFPNMAMSSETIVPELLLSGLRENTYQIIITNQTVESPDIICREFCTEQLFLTIPPAHPLSNHTKGIHLDDLAGETMLLIREIGIWKELVSRRMARTNFIVQDEDSTFSALVQASALPSFVTNLTMKHRGPGRIENRLILPILDPEASITFYCAVLKSNRSYLPE